MIDSFFFISFFSNVNAFDLNKLFCPNLVLILQSETSGFGCKGEYYILYAYSPSRLRSLFGYWVSRWIVFMKTFRSENKPWKYHEFGSELQENIRCGSFKIFHLQNVGHISNKEIQTWVGTVSLSFRLQRIKNEKIPRLIESLLWFQNVWRWMLKMVLQWLARFLSKQTGNS